MIPIDALVKLSREVKRTREEDTASQTRKASVVLFPDGDRLYRTAIGAANDTALEVQSFSLGHLNVPLDSLLGLVFHEPPNPDALGLPIGPEGLEGLVQPSSAASRGSPRSSG